MSSQGSSECVHEPERCLKVQRIDRHRPRERQTWECSIDNNLHRYSTAIQLGVTVSVSYLASVLSAALIGVFFAGDMVLYPGSISYRTTRTMIGASCMTAAF